MHGLSALIVDDEERAVLLLRRLLEDTERFEEIHSARSSNEAQQVVRKFKPDLIFLDIKMPGENGIEFLRHINEDGFNAEVIFVTAYDQFALQALQHHAFGYLLKPVNRQELDECIKAFGSRRGSPDPQRWKRLLDLVNTGLRIKINTRNGYQLIDPNAILWCEADGNYTRIQTSDNNFTCSLQLGAVEKMLPSSDFHRLGRSLIVNRHHIASVDRKDGEITFTKEAKRFTLQASHSQLKALEHFE